MSEILQAKVVEKPKNSKKDQPDMVERIALEQQKMKEVRYLEISDKRKNGVSLTLKEERLYLEYEILILKADIKKISDKKTNNSDIKKIHEEQIKNIEQTIAINYEKLEVLSQREQIQWLVEKEENATFFETILDNPRAFFLQDKFYPNRFKDIALMKKYNELSDKYIELIHKFTGLLDKESSLIQAETIKIYERTNEMFRKAKI